MTCHCLTNAWYRLANKRPPNASQMWTGLAPKHGEISIPIEKGNEMEVGMQIMSTPVVTNLELFEQSVRRDIEQFMAYKGQYRSTEAR